MLCNQLLNLIKWKLKISILRKNIPIYLKCFKASRKSLNGNHLSVIWFLITHFTEKQRNNTWLRVLQTQMSSHITIFYLYIVQSIKKFHKNKYASKKLWRYIWYYRQKEEKSERLENNFDKERSNSKVLSRKMSSNQKVVKLVFKNVKSLQMKSNNTGFII